MKRGSAPIERALHVSAIAIASVAVLRCESGTSSPPSDASAGGASGDGGYLGTADATPGKDADVSAPPAAGGSSPGPASSDAATDATAADAASTPEAGGEPCRRAVDCPEQGSCQLLACVNGTCQPKAAPDGMVCSDGDGCTRGDTCQAGACVAATTMACKSGLTCLDGVCSAPACGGVLGLPGPPATPVLGRPRGLAVGDVDRDGDLDAVITHGILGNSDPNGVSVLRNDGRGFFGAPTTYQGMTTPLSPVVTDLNGDGAPDIAVADADENYFEGPAFRVRVLKNGGDGTFSTWRDHGVSFAPQRLLVQDLNADGKRDVLTFGKDGRMELLANAGSGAFLPPVPYLAGVVANNLQVKDVDGNGTLDAVYAGVQSIRIRLGQSGGTFASESVHPVFRQPGAIAVTDLDGDGKTDLASVSGDHSLNVLFGRGGGAFDPEVEYGARTDGSSLLAFDVTGDGKTDLVAADRSYHVVTVFENLGNRAFGNNRSYGAPTVLHIAAGDLDADGRVDLTIANFFPSGVQPLLNAGNGSFRDAAHYGGPLGSVSLALTDVDGDGDLDVAVAELDNRITVLPNLGSGTFGDPAYTDAPGAPRAIAAVDMNDDGAPDLATANFYGNDVTLFRNDGRGHFTRTGSVPVGEGPRAIRKGDLDRDGHEDLVVINQTSLDVSILFNRGSGMFAPEVRYRHGASEVGARDLNGDGHLDFVTSTPEVLFGRGDGTYLVPVPLPILEGDEETGDLDGDGIRDRIAVDLSVSLGRADGTFGEERFYGSPIQESIPIQQQKPLVRPGIADLNGDGRLDVVTRSRPGYVGVFFGACLK